MVTSNKSDTTLKYLDMQAYVGVTKHLGGFGATNELLALCHIENAREILYVGSGIGVGPAYIARMHDCHVVGIDLSEKMIEWSRQRAREERVEAKVEFHTADVLDLPFETDRFDLVMAESVIAFVEDKGRAIQECIRVTKPGGSVGFNESFLVNEASPELLAQIRYQVGAGIPILQTWQALWSASGLKDQVIRTYEVNARKQTRSAIQWVGTRWALKAFRRLFGLYLKNPAIRRSIKDQFTAGTDSLGTMGYALFAGTK